MTACVFCGGEIGDAKRLRIVTRYSCAACWPPKVDVCNLLGEIARLRRALEDIARPGELCGADIARAVLDGEEYA